MEEYDRKYIDKLFDIAMERIFKHSEYILSLQISSILLWIAVFILIFMVMSK